MSFLCYLARSWAAFITLNVLAVQCDIKRWELVSGVALPWCFCFTFQEVSSLLVTFKFTSYLLLS